MNFQAASARADRLLSWRTPHRTSRSPASHASRRASAPARTGHRGAGRPVIHRRQHVIVYDGKCMLPRVHHRNNLDSAFPAAPAPWRRRPRATAAACRRRSPDCQNGPLLGVEEVGAATVRLRHERIEKVPKLLRIFIRYRMLHAVRLELLGSCGQSPTSSARTSPYPPKFFCCR